MKIKITKVCCIVFIFFTTIKLYSKELFNSMDNTFWISVDFIESLSDKNRNKLEEKYPNFRTIYNDYDGEKNIYWYERDVYEGIYFYLTDSETCKQLKQENFGKNAIDDSTKIIEYGVNASTFARYYFNEYKILNNEIIIKIIWEYIDNGAILNKKDWRYDSEKEDELKIILDGDYLQLYYCGNYVHTFCKLNEQTLQELKRFIKTETCDFTKVTWPRHADGTCDYEDVSSVKTVSSPTTNVSPNKTMTVSENLKLRSGEAITSEVLTVMSAGTKVKILELGKAENIDGINSNWVKVEVLSGVKDRDRRTIQAGTVGWYYGEYLK